MPPSKTTKKAPAKKPATRKSTRLPGPRSAQDLEGLSLATLRLIMETSESDPARVAAAKEVLSRAQAERDAAEKAAMGKKELQQRTAEERMVGKFAAPSAPPPKTLQ